jgi:hypothetical protein
VQPRGGRKPPVGTLHARTTTENHAKPALVQESALCGAAQRECTGDRHTNRGRSPATLRKRPCKCDTHTHGGLTPAALVSARNECPRMCAVLVLQARFPNHGGLTPAALFRRAFGHRKNRFFADKRSRSDTRAGGVSPPWEPCTRAQRLKIAQSRRWYKSQPFAEPLNANAIAIRTYTVGGPPNEHACICAIEFPTPTAGSRPPLLSPHVTSVVERLRYRCCKCVTHTHGGLTSAAPG